MLTNERIDEIAGPADYWDRRVFSRAIEDEVAGPLLDRIAALEGQLEASKMPVVYRTAPYEPGVIYAIYGSSSINYADRLEEMLNKTFEPTPRQS